MTDTRKNDPVTDMMTEHGEQNPATAFTFKTDAEIGRDMAKLSDAERLARALLLFHRNGPWMPGDREVWFALTGKQECSSRVLCDLAREVRDRAERK
jgi:hypothetical protein